MRVRRFHCRTLRTRFRLLGVPSPYVLVPAQGPAKLARRFFRLAVSPHANWNRRPGRVAKTRSSVPELQADGRRAELFRASGRRSSE